MTEDSRIDIVHLYAALRWANRADGNIAGRVYDQNVHDDGERCSLAAAAWHLARPSRRSHRVSWGEIREDLLRIPRCGGALCLVCAGWVADKVLTALPLVLARHGEEWGDGRILTTLGENGWGDAHLMAAMEAAGWDGKRILDALMAWGRGDAESWRLLCLNDGSPREPVHCGLPMMVVSSHRCYTKYSCSRCGTIHTGGPVLPDRHVVEYNPA